MINFNTTLVLFKLVFTLHHVCAKLISIPHWFYSNSSNRWGWSRIDSKFQYHTGSIQTFFHKLGTERLLLFQYHTGSIQTKKNYISLSFSARFQYHTGSIQTVYLFHNIYFLFHFNTTLVLFKPLLIIFWNPLNCISIPHWFYSNRCIHIISDFVCWISIPHWFYSNKKQHQIPPFFFSISIPHWFYSNCDMYVVDVVENAFQYHTGSIQTIQEQTAEVCLLQFQYHTGSIQTWFQVEIHSR